LSDIEQGEKIAQNFHEEVSLSFARNSREEENVKRGSGWKLFSVMPSGYLVVGHRSVDR